MFYRTLESNMRKDWEKQKELVFEELGRHAPSASTSTSIVSAPAGLRKSLGRDAGFGDISSSPSRYSQPGGSQLQMHPKMMRYGIVTQKLNNYRKQDIPFGVVNAYMEASTGGSSGNDTVSLNRSILSPAA
jgi:nuclear pore complex protein Nup93